MGNPLHVCLISQEFPPETGWGGLGSYTYDLSSGLANLGLRVSVVSRSLTDQDTFFETDEGVRVFRVAPRPDWARWPGLWRLNHLWPGFAWAVIKKVIAIHRDSPIDVIEAGENRADSYLLKLFCPEPKYVVRLHTATRFIDEVNQVEPGLRGKWVYRQEAWVLRHADCITAPCQAVVDLTRTVYPLPDAPLLIIPNPIDVQRFSPSAVSKRPLISIVGRLQINKGILLLCELLPRLLADMPELEIRMAGTDTMNQDGVSWQKTLLSRIPERDKSRLTISPVPRDALPDLYAASALTLMPSRWENFPYVVLESMACGTPVVASSVGGIPDMIDDGVNGFLVAPQDVNGFEEKIRRLLSDLHNAAEMGKVARKKVESMYALPIISPKVVRSYEELIQNG